MPNPQIDWVFLDVEGTLADRDPQIRKTGGDPNATPLLPALRKVAGLRVGVITTLGPGINNDQALTLFELAGLARYLDPEGIVSDHEAGVAKPDVGIFQFAARKVGVPIDRCLFVGENLLEVVGARAAGMKAVWMPSLKDGNCAN